LGGLFDPPRMCKPDPLITDEVEKP
jgi:hypothetical protein